MSHPLRPLFLRALSPREVGISVQALHVHCRIQGTKGSRTGRLCSPRMEAGGQTLHEATRGASPPTEREPELCSRCHKPQPSAGVADVTHTSCSSTPASAAAPRQADTLNTPPGAAASALQVTHLCCLSILPCSSGRRDSATELVTSPQNPDKGQLPPPPPGLYTTRSGMHTLLQILPGLPAATPQTTTERHGNSSAKAPAAVASGCSSFRLDTRSLGFHKLSS